MHSRTEPRLDHIVLLVPYTTLTSLPTWLNDALTVQPGGRHEDGLTENKLIAFPDGSYVELIAFVPGADPEKRRRHRWGRRPEGQIVDWALTLLADPDGTGEDPTETAFAAVRARVEKAQDLYVYADPVPGGRVRPDGTQLRWAVATPRRRGAVSLTSVPVHGHNDPPDPGPGPGPRPGPEPVDDVPGGEIPFFCLDRTPRALRVGAPPSSPGPGQQQHHPHHHHPCGAVGIGAVTVSVRATDMAALRRTYEAVQDARAKMIALESGVQSGFSWPLATPAAAGDGLTARLVLRELETEALLGTGIPARHVDGGEELVGTHVRLALFTRVGDGGDGGPRDGGMLVGDVGMGTTISIDLIPVQ